MRRNAFTLSELLISLLIIGIIAVLVVPSTVKNVLQGSNITKLEATYKNLSDAVKKMMVEERITWMEDSSLWEDPQLFFDKYLTLNKDCGTSYKGCFPDTYKSISGADVDESKFLFDDSDASDFVHHYVILPNGASVGFFRKYDNGAFVIDVNGFDKPNTLGRDFFAVQVDLNGHVGSFDHDTYGDKDERITRCKDAINYGRPCFSQLQANKWTMDY